MALGLTLATTSVAAELRLQPHFTDNMVLQRETPVAIRGYGVPGARVSVAFGAQRKEGVVGGDGRWELSLDAMPAGAEGRDLQVRLVGTDQEIRLADVLVGDVWLFGRQSWVDVALGRSGEGRAAAAAYEPTGTFRVLRIATVPALEPRDDLDGDAVSGWVPVDRDQARRLSGAAFHLGRALDRRLDVPVGIIDVDMGPYFAIGWLSAGALADAAARHPSDSELDWLPGHMRRRAEERLSGQAQQALDEYHAGLVEAAQARGRPVPEKPSLGLHPLRNPMLPSAGYNAVIHPLRGTALKGVLLQLGNDYPFIAYGELAREGRAQDHAELNAAWQENYEIIKSGFRVTPVTLPYVPADWRKAFGRADLPVGLVLPPGSDLDVYAKHNREIRELHRRTAAGTRDIGLILPGMANIPFSGQPADDAVLAERSLHWALGEVYATPGTPPSGPLLDRIEARFSRATVFFREGTAEGLAARAGALDFFEAAGADRVFSPATARISGTTVLLESDRVPQIAFVRYNWSEHPDQGLVNSAGLPALPFTTDPQWEFAWIVEPASPELPEEYLATADRWGESDIALINAQVTNLEGGDSQPIPRRPGPIGIEAAPFGPNIVVISVDADSPADGKLLPGDLIYGANRKPFGDDTYRELAAAITESETERRGGRLVLGIRRDGRIQEVELQLEVMGEYSATTPDFCPKTDRIVRRAEEAMTRQFRSVEEAASHPDGFLNTDILFLLATGTPEMQGLARRGVYGMMAGMDPLRPPTPGDRVSNWRLGYNALVFGEYYHATGDRNVLPYLENQVAWAALAQLKPEAETLGPYEAAQSEEVVGGYRHGYPTAPDRWLSGYGLLPHVGMAAVMGMVYAREAGLEIDERAYERGLTHLHKGRAEHAFIVYSYDGLRREAPPPIDPAREAAGMLSTDNGTIGNAAALFRLVDDWNTVELCSRHSVYAYNNTRGGHGGMFFNNFWTPIGAAAAGPEGYRHFMRNQVWWRELFRRHDGRFDQAGRGGIGVAYGLHYLAPRERLRMLGAPRTAFGPHAPEYLAPALEAHRARDYARAEALVLAHRDAHILPSGDIPLVENFLESIRILRASIEHDLSLVESRLAEGRYHHANLELAQLRGVVAGDDPRLKAIATALESPQAVARVRVQQRAADAARRASQQERRQAARPERREAWISLLGAGADGKPAGWKMMLTEHIRQAPTGWTALEFDDRGWDDALLPISWAMYHTPLFRTRFHLDDPAALDALRINGLFFQQMNVVIHINGKLVAKVDEIGRGGSQVVAPLTDLAREQLRAGENTLAVSTRHNRRWGPMRGTYTTVSHGGFSIDLEGRVRDE